MKNNIQIIILSIVMICGVLGFAYLNQKTETSNDGNQFKLALNDTTIKHILANTAETRVKGLSGMESLPKDTVMLFVFDTPDKYGIWMKDMKFPIDIIWLDQDGKVITLESNVSPDTFPKVFFPLENSLYTIEANSGFIDQNQLEVGSFFSITK